jgi:hypothetical protein
MSDAEKVHRWLTQAELDDIVNKAIETAVRGVLAMDSHVYDEDTIRAAAMVVRESIRRKS